MADIEFNTTAGQTIARELLIAYINTGTSASPTWSPLGTRVEDSSAEYDWSEETIQDILGNTFTTMKKPTVTQSLDPCPLDSGEAALTYIWGLAVKDQDAQALSAQDMLICHYYESTSFAERYTSCAVRVTGLGGEGGGNIEMPIEVTYGGTRTVGTATNTNGTVTFTTGSGE
jgi:hypothetical protein